MSVSRLVIRCARRFPSLLAVLRRLFPPRHDRRCLNIGGGRWYLPRWENLDYYVDGRFVDHRVDLRGRGRIDLPDGCAAMVFCSHVLEHLDDAQVAHLLSEVARLLRDGGVVRISVPDPEKALAAYRAGDEEFFRCGEVTCTGDTIEAMLVSFFASYRMDGHSGVPALDPAVVRAELEQRELFAFARWCVDAIPAEAPYRGHVNAHTSDKLCEMLRVAGFSEVRRSTFRGSSVPAMRGAAFDNRPRVSLFVEATK